MTKSSLKIKKEYTYGIIGMLAGFSIALVIFGIIYSQPTLEEKYINETNGLELEMCDGIDNNKDGTIDEGCIWCCDDDDGDGYVGVRVYEFVKDCSETSNGKGYLETPCNSLKKCVGGGGYGDLPNCVVDCSTWIQFGIGGNDNDDDMYPGAPEICDGLDNDCDGEIDEECIPPK